MIITEEHKKILPWLSAEYCYSYERLALVEHTGLSIKRLKELMLELKIAGYIKFETIWSEECMFKGGGHFLTYAGVRLLENLKIECKIEIEPDYY